MAPFHYLRKIFYSSRRACRTVNKKAQWKRLWDFKFCKKLTQGRWCSLMNLCGSLCEPLGSPLCHCDISWWRIPLSIGIYKDHRIQAIFLHLLFFLSFSLPVFWPEWAVRVHPEARGSRKGVGPALHRCQPVYPSYLNWNWGMKHFFSPLNFCVFKHEAKASIHKEKHGAIARERITVQGQVRHL